MSYNLADFEQHLYDLLSADATIQSLVGSPARIYSRVPQDEIYPYITITEITDNERGSQSLPDGSSIDLTISTWDENSSRIPIQNLQKAIDDVLHRSDVDNCTTGSTLTIMDFHRNSATVLLDPDNKTWHGVQLYTILVGRTT